MAGDQVSAGNRLSDGDDGRVIVAGFAPPDENCQRPGMGGHGLQAAGLTPSGEFIPIFFMGWYRHQEVIQKLIK